MQPTPEFFYKLISNIYYQQEIPQLQRNEIAIHEVNQCLLKSFLQRKLQRKLLNPKIGILTLGRLVHLALQDQLTKHGYQTEVEHKYHIKNITLYSHTDAIHENHILELKTITRMPSGILDHHFRQANAYAIIHQKPKGYVAYLHKPSGIIKVFEFKPYFKAFDYLVLRAVRLNHYLNYNKMPPPEPSWLCQYCEYQDICPNPIKYISRKGGM